MIAHIWHRFEDICISDDLRPSGHFVLGVSSASRNSRNSKPKLALYAESNKRSRAAAAYLCFCACSSVFLNNLPCFVFSVSCNGISKQFQTETFEPRYFLPRDFYVPVKSHGEFNPAGWLGHRPLGRDSWQVELINIHYLPVPSAWPSKRKRKLEFRSTVV